MAGNAILLDRVLAHYGAAADDSRNALHRTIAGMVVDNGTPNHLEQLE